MQTTAWAAFWRTVTRFDREKISPFIAIRNTIGVVAPLAIAAAVGQPSLGLVGSLGALNVAYSDGNDAYSLRARRMLLASVLSALALFAGGLTGYHHAIAVPVAALWAFGAGMLVALGTTAGDIGTVSLVTFVVFAARPLSASQAAVSGLVAFSAAILQTGLSLAFWPVRRYQQERSILAGIYGDLADLATRQVSSGAAPLATETFTKAQQSLRIRDSGSEPERLRVLLSQAERLRVRLLTLGRLRRRLRRHDPGVDASALLDEFAGQCRQLLSRIGNALGSGTTAIDATRVIQRTEGIVEVLRGREWTGRPAFFVALVRDAVRQMDALMGQIRAACRLVERDDFMPPAPRRSNPNPITEWRRRARNQLAILRANLSLCSMAFRHALRLAVCVAVGDAIGRGFEWRRSYWIPMTVAIVLKPDFMSTFSRGALRLAGTLAGLILATVLYRQLPASTATDMIFVGSFTLMLRWVGPANYGIFSIAVSALVVALIANTGVAPKDVIPLRAINTAMGGALALLAYALWPTWERTQSGESFARLLDAYRTYLRAVREAYIDSDPPDFPAIDKARLAARVARSNVEASAERLRMEPGVQPEPMQRVAAMLASSHDFIYAVMTLEGGAFESGNALNGEVRTYLDQVELTLYFLSAALRGSSFEPKDFPDLRAQHRRLIESCRDRGEPHSLLQTETDRMTNALNTLREQIALISKLEWWTRRSRPSRTPGT